ncbi:sulfatase-like hydrolase/transferase [Verrucomicrobiales bacterium BCK34]|nr:sulfatase-like hydrolase/transferase [Verrucomicrobiales bacterium BCK34]
MRFIILFFLLCLTFSAARSEEKPLNVLLICVDDLKPLLGCYGDPVAKTPAMDELASRGLLFESAYCNQAVCSPSRNSLMTGLRPQTIGIYDLPTNFRKTVPDAVTVAQHFQSHGYRTEALGKIMHKGHGNVEDAVSWTIPHFLAKAPTYVSPESTANGRMDSRGRKRGAATEMADVADETYADGLIAKEAVNRLAKAAAKPDEPFFIAVGFIRPHLPFVAPSKYWDLYDPDKLPMPEFTEAPEGAPSYGPHSGGELRQYSDIPAKDEIDETLTRELIHGYYAATSYADAQVGRLIEALDSNGLSGNTIIVLWGDHGWHLGDHSIWCKHTNYEQAARIPLIVVAPGGAKNARSGAFIETVDLYPTLAELAGLPGPKRLDGVSQAAVIADPETAVRDHVIHVYPRGGRLGRAIRTERYRMVEWKVPGSSVDTAEFELYDYVADPLETKNLASSEGERLNELREILATHPEAKPQYRVVTPEQLAKKKAAIEKRVRAFKTRDEDGDGRLTLEEFLIKQPDPEEAPKRFPVFDRNGDGSLSEDEYVNAGK